MHFYCASRQGLSVSPKLFSPAVDKAIIDTLALCVDNVHSVHKLQRNGNTIWYAVLKGQEKDEVQNAVLTLSARNVQKSQVILATRWFEFLQLILACCNFCRYATIYGKSFTCKRSRRNHITDKILKLRF